MPKYFQFFDINLLEKVSNNFNTLTEENKADMALVLQQLFEKGDEVSQIMELNYLDFKFTSNYKTEIKHIIDEFNDNYNNFHINEKPTLQVQHVIVLNKNFDDCSTYRAPVILTLKRSKIDKCFIDKDTIIVGYDKDLYFASSFIHYLLSKGIKTIHIKVPSDDIMLSKFENLIYMPYWVIPGSMVLLEVKSKKILELVKSYNTFSTIYQNWEHLKVCFPKRFKRIEQYGQHSYSNVSYNSLTMWKEVHHAIANKEHPPRVHKAHVTNWEGFNVMGDRYYIMQLQTAVSVGTAFGQGGNLVSNQHVTNGKDVMYTNGESTYIWTKPNLNDVENDLVVYGDEPVIFADVSVGEIVVAVNPPANWAQYFVCTGFSPDKKQRMFRAVIIEDDTF